MYSADSTYNENINTIEHFQNNDIVEHLDHSPPPMPSSNKLCLGDGPGATCINKN